MTDTELTAYIVHHLGEGDDPEDIILDVCQKTGYSWPEAEELVRQVREKDALQITEKQFPLLTGVALVTFVAGLILTVYGVFSIVNSLANIKGNLGPPDITSYLMPVIEKGVDPASALRPAISPYFNLILGVAISPISALIFGIAMILGSLLGMRNVWYELLTRK